MCSSCVKIVFSGDIARRTRDEYIQGVESYAAGFARHGNTVSKMRIDIDRRNADSVYPSVDIIIGSGSRTDKIVVYDNANPGHHSRTECRIYQHANVVVFSYSATCDMARTNEALKDCSRYMSDEHTLFIVAEIGPPDATSTLPQIALPAFPKSVTVKTERAQSGTELVYLIDIGGEAAVGRRAAASPRVCDHMFVCKKCGVAGTLKKGGFAEERPDSCVIC